MQQHETTRRKVFAVYFNFFLTQFKYQPICYYVMKIKDSILCTPNWCNLYNRYWFWPQMDMKPAVKEKTDAAPRVFLIYTALQFWLLRTYEIVATFFGL